MKISLIVQSRGDLVNLKHIIACYCKQLHKQRELILVIDQIFTQESYRVWQDEITSGDTGFFDREHIRIYSNLNASFVHQNVSAMRNFGIQNAKGDYINLMDDDEDFYADYFVKSLEYYKKYKNLMGKEVIIVPTLMFRHSGKIQNQGFSRFNYWISRPVPCVLRHHEYAEIQMYSGNSLFGAAQIFQQYKMDERFDFVYEDLDYSHSLFKAGISIIVLKALKIFHMEREKNKLEQAWVGNIYQAYRKAKHRILFVQKYATSYQKLQFYILGFRGQPLRLFLKVLLFGERGKKSSIIKAIRKGTWDSQLQSLTKSI